MRAFHRIGVPFKVVVEPQEAGEYSRALGGDSRLLVLPHRDKGLVATRNWIWDHAAGMGVRRFWTFDDNFTYFSRFHRNSRIPVGDGKFLEVMEDFVDRYVNIVIAGMQYDMFCPNRECWYKPVDFNTRVYSNMLIDTFAVDRSGRPYRNEGFYNDDTDLNLRVLKDGHCTALFYAFLGKKQATMREKGGMTQFYEADNDGRWRATEELRRKHPDVVKVTRKWGRWHHHVDYRPFKGNKLVRRPGVEIPDGADNHGMDLKWKY